MRVAFVDPFSGASGDMLLGALIDAGVSLEDLNRELANLGISGVRVAAETITRHGISGTLASVTPESGHHERSWRAIREIIEQSTLDPEIKSSSLLIFGNLADAEATVHGVPVEDVRFHEVGALDTIVDIVGTVIGLRLLGIEQLYCGPLHIGGGVVSTAHGLLPVPAPATARLLATHGAPIAPAFAGEGEVGELLTPTGAAILGTLATFSRPAMYVSAIGSGFGSKDLPWPNMCRLMVGDVSATTGQSGESLTVLETNIDDMNPQFVEILLERLLAHGALDAWTTPIAMKKGRPALLVSALARPADAERLTELLILQSTTLGVRQTHVDRIAAERQMESVETRWGAIRIKLKIWNKRVVDIAPEYDDCAAVAREHDIAVRDVWNEAHLIGQVYIGRRTGSSGSLSLLDPIGPGAARQLDS
jgi:pyridinium-3,5-bisthiocarboxylic acid mononucleotide nickel chelatase